MKYLVKCSCNTDLGIVEIKPDKKPHGEIPLKVAEITGSHIRKGHEPNLIEL